MHIEQCSIICIFLSAMDSTRERRSDMPNHEGKYILFYVLRKFGSFDMKMKFSKGCRSKFKVNERK